MESKRKVGRPAIETSQRQQKLKAQQERVEKGEILVKGRPVNTNSKRQQRLIEKQAIIDAGGTIRAGRPRKEEMPAII